MTAREIFVGSMSEVRLTSTYRGFAKRQLNRARTRVDRAKAAKHSTPSMLLDAERDLHNAVAVAQEWGVAGLAGGR